MRRSTVLAILVIVSGCQDRQLAWSYRIDPAIDADTIGVRAYLHQGGCQAPRSSTYVARRRSVPMVSFPQLVMGTWGFEVEAVDERCQVIGQGCQTVALPTDALAITVDVTEVRAMPMLPCDICEDGECRSADGGM